MRRRDFTICLLLTAAVGTVRPQEPAKQHRIAIVIPSGPVARISDSLPRFYQPFFEELLRLGDVEGQNLTIERYSGEGRREGFADLAREVVTWNPDVIVAITNPVAQAVRAANGTIPIRLQQQRAHQPLRRDRLPADRRIQLGELAGQRSERRIGNLANHSQRMIRPNPLLKVYVAVDRRSQRASGKVKSEGENGE
jgi:hypothetical protein